MRVTLATGAADAMAALGSSGLCGTWLNMPGQAGSRVDRGRCGSGDEALDPAQRADEPV
ncbi:hypothetical protein AB0I10_36100 [Streptomyces sp. NPDC050636]|uniref:hypothetical protein n=1 Tax=Streptomyces sp. NPDC050636 TaxID=3154510 RepID=UPI0034313221